MNHIALARKYRPQSFSALIGQDHVTKAISNSLTRNRLHHAYLFTGTRGVGKTSIARLFAKALNCESGITATPCLTCNTCLSVEQGNYIDLIEIDAASKTRVEDTRELLDNVMYSPTQGRFKVYLIDEVHMLSTHSFNALLKTLEEPPSHVIFLLATTEVHKLPVTVLSRCLQFHLQALPIKTIEMQLAHILTEESMPYAPDALSHIAKAADGSMRDALSLLDQIIALSDGYIKTDPVKEILGYTKHDYAFDILTALADNAPKTLLEISQAIARDGGQYTYVLEQLLAYLHQLSILHILPEETPITSLCDKLSPEDTQLLYQIAQKGQEELALSPTRLMGFEMTLLRMYTFKHAGLSAPPPLAYEIHTPKTTEPLKQNEPSALPPPLPEPSISPHIPWEDLIPKLNLSGLALNAAKQADFIFTGAYTAELRFNKNHRSLFTASVIQKIEQQLNSYYAKTIKLTLKSDEENPNSPAEQQRFQQQKIQNENQATLDADPIFQILKNTFQT